MNRRIRDIIFFLICVSLIFNTVPQFIQMGFLGGPIGGKLTFYPLAVGFLYSSWCHWKNRDVFVDFKPFARYILAYLGIMLLSTAWGLYQYPYYEAVLNGPIDQIEKIPKVLAFCEAHGISIDAKSLIQVWVVVRQLKGVVMEAFWLFGGAYLIYCWYCKEWKRMVSLLITSIMAAVAIFIAYSTLELPYLAHNKTAEELLKTINPYIHAIKTDGKWWPPLLWKNKVRSIFAESSYFGMYAAFALPWLWYKLYKVTNWRRALPMVGMVFVFSTFVILTGARTAFMLHLGGLAVFMLLVVIFERNKEACKRFLGVLCISLAAFVAGNLFIDNCIMTSNDTQINGSAEFENISEAMSAYVESNAESLKNPDARSNRARYSVMMADSRIGLEHPVLGVGKGLRSSYIPDYFDEKALQNKEVLMWLDFRERLGIMRSGIPPLGEYTIRFAETGVIGLIIYFLPLVLLVRRCFGRLVEEWDRPPYIFFLVSLAGITAAGIGDTINITYCYWLLLGMGYAMCFGKPGDEQKI